MHATCLDCVHKHLCAAMVIHEEEVPLGYPKHIRRVIGHLNEASREAMPLYPQLAEVIRAHRLKVRETKEYYPPYNALLDYVDITVEAADASLPAPELPEDVRP